MPRFEILGERARPDKGATTTRPWRAAHLRAAVLGYPTSDERNSNVPGGRFSRFQGGSTFWIPDRRIDVRWNID